MGSTPNQDRAEGFGDKAKGRVKEAGGALTGDRSLANEGRGDQAKGTLKEKKGLLRKLFR
jgi:uncharacterized protein YjbJ (UPF0337 family)